VEERVVEIEERLAAQERYMRKLLEALHQECSQ
jgi:hypothetical protein